MILRLFLFFLGTLLSTKTVAQNLNPSADSTDWPVLEWEHNSFTFGDIIQGSKVSHTYTFKNTGKKPLIISNVLVTCGCTVPEWPKNPVPPRKTGSIKIFFNSSGKSGQISKTITILTNTKSGRETAMFSANVFVPVK